MIATHHKIPLTRKVTRKPQKTYSKYEATPHVQEYVTRKVTQKPQIPIEIWTDIQE